MTTASFATRVRHDSDVNFREWAQEIHDQFVAIGLIQTSDTGQANLATMTRPAAGVFTLYEIFRFNDSLQGTAPIFLRVEFSTGSGGATHPYWRIGVGTGTDGAGTLTATGINGTTPITALGVNFEQGGFSNADTTRQSDFCYTEGFLGISWKNVTTTFALPGGFALCRTCDDDGVPDARGIFIDWPKGAGGQPTRQAVRFTPEPFGYPRANTTPNYDIGFLPQAPASSAISGDNQVALAWTFCDGAEPLFGLCGVYPAQIALQSTFSVAMVGTTSRTYKVITGHLFGNPTTMRTAMLWE